MSEPCDYLVKGCGASAMAFVDVMLRETDATFAIVDKRAAPGGHWNDAYPFVRLHQPSAFYGVASRALGYGRLDESGFNAGLYELASGFEVADYFHQVMRDHFLPSGRVRYFPMSKLTDEGHIVGLLNGERHVVEPRRATVDATMLRTSIPLTHIRAFAVESGVACVPPNDLPRLAPGYRHFTVLGAGKTAIDALLWLLSHKVEPEQLSWVVPRDPWLFNRANFQPGMEFFDASIGGIADQWEVCAKAGSIEELCLGMEANGRWLRLDPDVWPTMFHGASVTPAELEQLRRVKDVIRKGRVTRLEPGRIDLDHGVVEAPDDSLYIDCTARAHARTLGDTTPVFQPGRIHLQLVRRFQPSFSAALIGHIEATVTDMETKRSMTRVVPMNDTIDDWVESEPDNMLNQFAWTADPAMAAWIADCRLDLSGAIVNRIDATDPAKIAILARLQEHAEPAVANLRRLARRLEAA
jgi:hypothetical protein